ncbi:MAG: hypothetical protein CVU20_07985 [Betaproteobacteria bacterium HGW-Betaproteobacteria-14]|nr:MAG: hypothetical protein CVU20_07985 [Betaproteobacteria bacterium HGW-Betaproteobacteria-14]
MVLARTTVLFDSKSVDGKACFLSFSCGQIFKESQFFLQSTVFLFQDFDLTNQLLLCSSLNLHGAFARID